MIELVIPFLTYTLDPQSLDCIEHPKQDHALCFWHEMSELPPNQNFAIWYKNDSEYTLLEAEQYSMSPITYGIFSPSGNKVILQETDEGHSRFYIHNTSDLIRPNGRFPALGVLDDFGLYEIDSFSDEGKITYKADCTYSQTSAASGQTCIRIWKPESSGN